MSTSSTEFEDTSSQGFEGLEEREGVEKSSKKKYIYLGIFSLLGVFLVLISFVVVVFIILYIFSTDEENDVVSEMISVSFERCENEEENCFVGVEEKFWIPGIKNEGFLSPPIENSNKDIWLSNEDNFEDVHLVYNTESRPSDLVRNLKGGKWSEKLRELQEDILPLNEEWKCEFTCVRVSGVTRDGEISFTAYGEKLALIECWARATEGKPTETKVTKITEN